MQLCLRLYRLYRRRRSTLDPLGSSFGSPVDLHFKKVTVVNQQLV